MALKIANNLVPWVHLMVGNQAAHPAGHFGVPFQALQQMRKTNGNLANG